MKKQAKIGAADFAEIPCADRAGIGEHVLGNRGLNPLASGG